jgi:RNA polymerase subunit RPABC4/transcription elongation factor Spt4
LSRKKTSEGYDVQLRYCSKCGARLKDDDKFCYACGASAADVTREEFSVSAKDLDQKIRELLHEGNVTRVIIKDEKGATLLEIPATVGVIGAVIAPWLAALGVIAALATNCRIVVERRQ